MYVKKSNAAVPDISWLAHFVLKMALSRLQQYNLVADRSVPETAHSNLEWFEATIIMLRSGQRAESSNHQSPLSLSLSDNMDHQTLSCLRRSKAGIALVVHGVADESAGVGPIKVQPTAVVLTKLISIVRNELIDALSDP